MLGPLKQGASQWPLLGAALTGFASTFNANPEMACSALKNLGNEQSFMTNLNMSILSTTYFDGPAQSLPTLGSCQSSTNIEVPLCRVQFVVNTSDRSKVTGEAWLPTDWSGRSLVIGNGGLTGCIIYDSLVYGSSLGFATVASNNGHDGGSGESFLNNAEVLADFVSRSIHVSSLVGKALSSTLYGHAPNKAYYLGCSTGGRQAFYSALHHPDDFDGILAGAPAVNFDALLGSFGMLSGFLGGKEGKNSPKYISPEEWDLVHDEVLRQCDALDGVVDGIVAEPDACDFRPEELLCKNGHERCLTKAQVSALRKVYQPIYGSHGQLLIPRFDPGTESAAPNFFNQGEPQMTMDWLRYVVFTTDYTFDQFGLEDFNKMVELDAANISTFSGDLSAFRDRGGKLISYHGRADWAIPSGLSKQFYNLVSRTLGLHASELDDFYRLFLVPGMGHCSGGTGCPKFGQILASRVPAVTNASNILMELVKWVEEGEAPDVIIGLSADGKEIREHCRYPQRSFWNGEKWYCT